MSTYKQIRDDIINALKNKNKRVLITLRSLDSAIQSIVKDKGCDITDILVADVIKKSIKDRESAKIYAVQASRDDLIAEANEEISILGKYLPKTLSVEETEEAVVEAIASTGASSKKDMGKVMGYLKSKYGAELDMDLTSGIVAKGLQ